MKPSYLLVLCLLPVLTTGLEMAVGIAEGLVFLKGSATGYEERRIGLLDEVSIRALALDSTRGRIFFSRTRSLDGILVEVIQLGNEHQPTIETVIEKIQGPESIRSLAYDERRNTLYWTDLEKHEISTINVDESFNGQNVTVLHKFESTKHLLGITIDICHEFLFWTTNSHKHSTVERSNLDGTGRIVIADTNLALPMTVVVDPVGEGRLFWADKMESNYYKIETSQLNGFDRKILLKGAYQIPFTLSFVPSHSSSNQSGILLWTDTLHDAIWEIAVTKKGDASMESPKKIYEFNKINTLALVVKASFAETHQMTCDETSIDRVVEGGNKTVITNEEKISSNLEILEELGKVYQPSSPLEEPTAQTEPPATTSKVVEETKPMSPSQQEPIPTIGVQRNYSRKANPLKLQLYASYYCVNGEPTSVNAGPLECKCLPGYFGPRCEKSLCDNYCFNGTCSLERGLEGKMEPRCDCDDGFVGPRCAREPCWKYCLNGGLCRVEMNGQPKCSCPGNGKVANGERCEKSLNYLEKACALLCSLDSLKTSISYVPLKGKEEYVGDAEEPLCICPSGTTKYTYSTAKGVVNVTGERGVTETSTSVISPVVLALVGVCIVLLVIAIYLTYKVMKLRRLPRIKKRIIVSKGSVPLAAGCGGGRPGKSPSSASPVLEEQQQCEITIENCCNMNVCETPCFEPQLRSPGKSGSSKNTSTKEEEKKVLLVNMEGPKTSCGPCPGAEELY